MPIGGSSGFTVSVAVSADRRRATVCLAGNIDIDTRRQLANAIDQLAQAVPATVDIDVAAVEFAGSVLPNFLARLYGALPASSRLTVSHPAPPVRLVLDLTDMAEIVKIQPAFAW